MELLATHMAVGQLRADTADAYMAEKSNIDAVVAVITDSLPKIAEFYGACEKKWGNEGDMWFGEITRKVAESGADASLLGPEATTPCESC